MAENTNDSQVVETEEELTNYTTETNAGAGTGTSAIEPGYGTGRRKEAVARVRLVPGDGKWTINGRTLEEYFPSKLLQREVNSPIVLLKLEGKFDAIVLVDGGGTALRGFPRRAFCVFAIHIGECANQRKNRSCDCVCTAQMRIYREESLAFYLRVLEALQQWVQVGP